MIAVFRVTKKRGLFGRAKWELRFEAGNGSVSLESIHNFDSLDALTAWIKSILHSQTEKVTP